MTDSELPDLSNRTTKDAALRAFFGKLPLWNQIEAVPLDNAIGRVCAQALTSQNTLPVVRASMMDGIAVASHRFKNGIPETTGWIEGRDFARADTGDDFDDAFDAVIPIEEVSFDGSGRLLLAEGVEVFEGSRVRRSGSAIRRGEPVASPGIILGPSDLAALAMGGITEVPVVRKPVAAFIPTGTELVPAGTVPERGQNIDCNTVMARHLLSDMGAEPWLFPIVSDAQEAMERALEKALKTADIVILNGGSSKGRDDLTARLLKKHGEVVVHGIAAGPGRPMCLAIIDGKPVINLPGPVVAAYYGLDWCVRAVVSRHLGIPLIERERVSAFLAADMPCPPPIAFLCRLQVTRTGDTYVATPVPFRSATMGAWLSTNGQFVSQIGAGDHKKGDILAIELLRGKEFIPAGA
jgi:molybdopterin molybdotransferase/putative molybdopterin biosynthesis protein